jgi:hypothetical protein
MQIDPTIVAAIENGQLTCEQVVEAVERLVLQVVAARAREQGFDPVCVDFALEEQRLVLSGQRSARVETLREMLAAGQTSIQ